MVAASPLVSSLVTSSASAAHGREVSTPHPTPPPPPSPVPGPLPPASSPSKTAVGLGVGGAGFAAWLVDRVLLDGGDQAAAVLTKLGPVLGPVWASWPLIGLVCVIAWIVRDRWAAAQLARAAEATALAASVGDVASGLGALRGEVHALRAGLQEHAEKTDERMRHHEAGLDGLRVEVGQVRERVDVLELRPRPRARRPA